MSFEEVDLNECLAEVDRRSNMGLDRGAEKYLSHVYRASQEGIDQLNADAVKLTKDLSSAREEIERLVGERDKFKKRWNEAISDSIEARRVAQILYAKRPPFEGEWINRPSWMGDGENK